MDNSFNCLACGVDFGDQEAAQANHLCPDCGAELVEKEGVSEVEVGNKIRTGRVCAMILALLGLAIFLFWKAGGDMVPQTVGEILSKAPEVNNKLPMMIDPSTRLDRVVVEGKTIIYQSTLVNLTSAVADKDVSKRELFKKKIVPFLAEKYCNDKSTRKAIGLGVKYGHEYFGNDGALLYTANISVDDC